MHEARRPHIVVTTSPPQTADFVSMETNHDGEHQKHHYENGHKHHLLHKQFHHKNQESRVQQTNVQYESYFTCTQFSNAGICPQVLTMCNVEEESEDVDDDQVSNLDEEDELRLCYEQYIQNVGKQPDITSQLLQFANRISADISTFFGRSKTQNDSCDVYENKWATTKSGRELYYADMLRVARGDSETSSETTKNASSCFSSSSGSPIQEACCALQFSGKRDASIGMGPLSELFEYGLHSFLQSDKTKMSLPSGSIRRTDISLHGMPHMNRLENPIPMQDRSFPNSFWREPPIEGSNQIISTDPNRLDHSQQSTQKPSTLPVCSELAERWQSQIEVVGSNIPQKRSRRKKTEK